MEPVCKGFEGQIRIRNLDFNLWANSMTISLIKWTGHEEDKKGEKEEKTEFQVHLLRLSMLCVPTPVMRAAPGASDGEFHLQ